MPNMENDTTPKMLSHLGSWCCKKMNRSSFWEELQIIAKMIAANPKRY